MSKTKPTPQAEKQPRKTYSLDAERSRELAHYAVDMGEELGKTVARQDILDALVLQLKDKTIYKKVLKALK